MCTTSAPNRHRPLSGSNALLISRLQVVLTCTLLGLLVLTGCDPQGRTRRTPVPTQPPVVTQDKDVDTLRLPDDDLLPDTLIVDELDPDKIPDLDLPVGPSGATVSVMLPFFGDRFYSGASSLPQNSDWAVGYYAGMRLALEDLERAGERAQVFVYDTQGDAGKSQRLVQEPKVRESHVLFAPYLADNVRAVTTPAKAINLPVVVPYSAASKLGEPYARLVQLNPGLLRHLDGMAEYLSERYEPEQVVLVGLPTGEQNQEIAYLQRRHQELSPKQAAWRTWQLSTSDVGLQDLEWEDKFVEGKQTVFVFPAYRNPKIVLSFMSQLQVGRGVNDATVFGMPQWAEFNQLDASVMEDLGVLITAGFHVSDRNPDVRAFEDRFVDRYGAIPPLSAYLGYDAMSYVLPLANQYGRAWTENLPTQYSGMASKYRIRAQFEADATDAEADPVQLENTAIQVLKYQNFGFRTSID